MHAYDMYEKVCLLQRIGLPDVSVVDGGFTRWTQLGFDTETGEEPKIQVSLWRRQFEKCAHSVHVFAIILSGH